MKGWHLCCPLLVQRSSDASHQPHWRKSNDSRWKRRKSKGEKAKRYTVKHKDYGLAVSIS